MNQSALQSHAFTTKKDTMNNWEYTQENTTHHYAKSLQNTFTLQVAPHVLHYVTVSVVQTTPNIGVAELSGSL